LGQCQYLRTREHADSKARPHFREGQLSHFFSPS